MRKVNLAEIEEGRRASPRGKFGASFRKLSVALGREEQSTDLLRRHPFDVAICRIEPGKALCPFHSHSAQWEFYHVLSGKGSVRHADGTTAVGPGDAFLFPPGEPHQLLSDVSEELVYLIVADNPVGETCHYPDSGKWLVQSPGARMMRSENLDYFDGEE